MKPNTTLIAWAALAPLPVLIALVGFSRRKRPLPRSKVNASINLRGSIFQWANEGRPRPPAGGPTQEVSPYDARWSTLLDRAR